MQSLGQVLSEECRDEIKGEGSFGQCSWPLSYSATATRVVKSIGFRISPMGSVKKDRIKLRITRDRSAAIPVRLRLDHVGLGSAEAAWLSLSPHDFEHEFMHYF